MSCRTRAENGAASKLRHSTQISLFHEDFDTDMPHTDWKGPAGKLDSLPHGGNSLHIENKDAGGSVNRQMSLPPEEMSGQLITLKAKVKATNVSKPPNHWNGIKVMLILENEHGKQHPQLRLPIGTFDWMEATRVLRLPKGITKATLVLGLEKVSGSAWFDDVQILRGRTVNPGKRQRVRYKGHDFARLRGVMHGPRFNENHIRDLAVKWKANQIRWQLNWTPMKKAEEWAKDLDLYDEWLDGALKECDKALDACERYGIKVLVDLHTPPGGRAEGGVCRLFTEKRYQEKLVVVWKKIARRYKGRKVIYAYDLLNEPVEARKETGLPGWRELATKLIRAIRKIDPGKPAVFEPGPWGGPDGFDTLVPLDVGRVIYSFHMYRPHSFTHQGVHGKAVGLTYPGVVDGLMWDKDRLREAMIAAIEFQREYNVHIYVGEFSAIRWAPDNSAYRYLRDVIDLFEEYKWDWSYHAFREWEGWSVEHGADPKNRKPSSTPTDRQKLLMEWFSRN